MKRLAIVAAFLLATAVPAWSWTVTADFESGTVGNLANGTSGFTYAGSATTYSSTRAAAGTKSARMVWPQCSSECGWGVCHGEMDHPDITDGTEIWMRGYFYFESNWQWGSGIVTKIMRFRVMRPDGTHTGYISFFQKPNGQIVYSNEPADSTVGSASQQSTGHYFDIGAWQYLELYVNFSWTNPRVRMWKNGTLIFSTTHPVMRVAGSKITMANYMNIWNSPGSPQVQTQYIDEVVITTDRPANQDAAGNWMIGAVGGDTTPPALSGAAPSGTLACTSDPRDVTLSITSNEAATARMATSDMAYDAMTDTFTTTGGTSHSEVKSLACGQSYTYYMRAADGAGNKSAASTLIQFSISSEADVTPPALSAPQPSGTLACTSNPLPVTLAIASNEAATARMATADMAYDAMTDTFATTGGTSHSEVKSLACGQSYTYYVRAADGAGNKSVASTPIQFSVAAAGAPALLTESFEDGAFAARGWYDGTGGTIVAGGNPGNCLECSFSQGGLECAGGAPKRRLFAATETLYISYYIKFDTGWTSSNRAYHPHIIYVLSDLDADYAGPSDTYQTLYLEENEGRFRIGAGDGKNIDEANLGVDLCAVSEARAVHGCNGICDSNTWGSIDCYDSGGADGWRNNRMAATGAIISAGQWYHVEAWIRLNTVAGGVGQANGEMRLWVDGAPLISQTNMIYRTGQRATMKLRQLILSPYIGDGSPVAQTLWIDELVLAQSLPGQPPAPAVGGAAFKGFSGAWQ